MQDLKVTREQILQAALDMGYPDPSLLIALLDLVVPAGAVEPSPAESYAQGYKDAEKAARKEANGLMQLLVDVTERTK